VRLRLDLAYDGTDFSGWAIQPGLRTVQGELEQALATVLRMDDPPRTTCAGRTDTGVHARHQVVHVDVEREAVAAATSAPRRMHPQVGEEPCEPLMRRLNGLLGADLRVRAATEVSSAFDARFSALSRRYAYRIVDDPRCADPLLRGSVVSWRRPLDAERMNAAAGGLLGEHDFAAFCKRREGATTIRRLQQLSWTREASGILTATVLADAFCHHMVRSLVGCLIVVGEGSRPLDWPRELLAEGTRSSWVNVAPAHGLTLEHVEYPAAAEFASQAAATRRVRSLG
jgi:tRNA pseudouridine38-40 synthase